MNYYSFSLFLSCLFSFCLCEITEVIKSKLLSDFINYYNYRPNVKHKASDGFLQSINEIDDTTYQIEVSFRAQHNDVSKMMKCQAGIEDLDEKGIAIVNNAIDCMELEEQAAKDADASLEAVEAQAERRPVLLENEDEVDPGAQEVQDLAHMGVRHLNIHEPSAKHSLDSVVDVKKQVQVVNGVRYILTLSINFNNCTEIRNDFCTFTKTCRISILVKPGQTLRNGAKYRAVLANTCIKKWQFSDDNEDLLESTDSTNSKIGDKISNRKSDTLSQPVKETNKDYVLKTESSTQFRGNSIFGSKSNKVKTGSLSQDKRKAIDEMLDFLNISGYKPQVYSQTEDRVKRSKRSYDYDLQVLSLTQDYRDLKKQIENAKYIYEMAQVIVDYLNIIDIEVKNRAVKNVIKAEEEEDDDKKFVYIQVQVVIPCDTSNCEPKDSQSKICNGVVDSTNKEKPQVLYSFCYNDDKEMAELDKFKEVESDDPVLQRLSKEALKKIEFDSTESHAMKIKKIASAKTRLASSRLTKISLVLEYSNCNKSVPLVLRKKCLSLEHLGSQICEVLVHERQWLKEKTITYTCTERPMDFVITKDEQHKSLTIDDPLIAEVMRDALQYLEIQSNKKFKQKVIKVSNISTKIVAGFLIKIEFVVGYTNCTDTHMKGQLSNCVLLKNERLRRCKAQVWDRSWIVDGRQMDVLCEDDLQVKDILPKTRGRREVAFKKDQNQETSFKSLAEESDKKNLRDTSKKTLLRNEIEQNMADPIYLQLAMESLQKYLIDTRSQESYSVRRIKQVTTQVVAGSMTRIHFIAVSNANHDGHVLECFSKIWELNKREIDVSCVEANQRPKRQIVGGQTEQNPNDPVYMQLAQESLQKYLVETGNQHSHSVSRIKKVTTQVVAGSMTRIHFTAVSNGNYNGPVLECFSKIWEFNEKQINVSCVDMYESSERDNIPGGEMEQNPKDPRYIRLAQESLQKYLTQTGNFQSYSVVEIGKVTTQVVAGFMTRIHFTAVSNGNNDGSVLECFSKILEFNKKEIDVSCVDANQRSKRQIVGGETERNPNDPVYMQLAQESLKKYFLETGNQQPLLVVRLDKVTTQVVSGTITRIRFRASLSTNSNDHVYKCFSKIWEQRWLNKTEIDVSCVDENQRSKRQIPGGETEQNPNDPVYIQLAQESLQKYVLETGNQHSYSVNRIKKVTTQVVAGSMTRIHFTAVSNGNYNGPVLECFSKIWEFNEKQINVSCVDMYESSERDNIPGSEMEQNPKDPRYIRLAQESLQKYLTQTGNFQSYSVVEIGKVTTQVVAGFMTRIHFTAVSNGNDDGSVLECLSKILEFNKKEIDVSCVDANQRSKRQIVGGETEQNPNDPVYMQLAQESLKKYLLETGNQQPLLVVRIDKVTTQVVSGTITRIRFRASLSTNSNDHVYKCFSKIWEQRWLNKTEIDVSCVDENQRSKRQIVGGETERNPNDPVYMQLAQESLKKYLLETGNQQPLLVVRIDKVTTQVVSGTMTRIKFIASLTTNSNDHGYKCFSKIWEQRWLNKTEIDVSCVDENQRSKRQIPGGETEQNPNDPVYIQLAQESLQKYVLETGNQHSYSVSRIKKVTTQVVAGSMTRIHFTAVSNGNYNGPVLECYSKIWEFNEKQINVSCVDMYQSSERDNVPGGEMEQNPKDLRYIQLAQESLQKYLTQTGNFQSYSVVEIGKVTTQVVAGFMTRIHLTAVSNGNDDGPVLECFSKILEFNKKEIDVSCVDANQRSKRQIVGGETEQNPNDPVYMQLAQESLKKYLLETGNQQPLLVVRIDKVTTQVVSGTMTRIGFRASLTTNSNDHVYKCFSKIWEQRWLNKTEIDVSCVDENQRSKRQIPGGETEQNPNDPVYMQLAQESLQKYVLETENQHLYSVNRIKKVTTQVVAGSMTRIHFTAVSNGNYNGPVLECFSKIWEFNEKQINVSCVDMYESSERDNIPGGEMEQNPKDLRYIQLAQESLQKYLTQTGNFQSYSVVEIGKVTTQVVAGFMTRIHFTAVSNGNNDGPVLECFSKILEFNKKEIDVSCVDANQRSKRQIVGGEIERNPNDPVYMQLAQESLKKYLLETGNQQPLLVVRIDKVTTQVVSGTMTRIKFIASLTTNSNDHGYKCFSKIWEQRWLNKTEIDVSCVDENQRSKRQIPGGETEQNPNDPVYIQLAQESLQKYVLETGNQHSYSVNRIRKVTTQVVAGSMTRIHFTAVSNGNYNGPVLDCFSKIWEFNEKQINVSCVDMYQSSERDNVSGGEIEQNPKDLRYIQLAQESLQKYLTQTGNFQSYSVVEIGKVTTQVVAGFMTRIHFTAVSNGNNDGPVLECFSKILEFNKKEIDVSCVDANQRSKRQIVGGEIERNPNDPVYMQLAQESLKKYLLETGNQQPLLVVRIDKVTTQVVSGTMTRIRFRASLTTNSNDHGYKCFSKIWEQLWLNKTEIDVSCVDENQRSKRQIPGGEMEQNPNDPVYIQLAQESLQKYVLETGNQHSYSVSRIKKVTTQVVAGSMTRIHFTAVTNGNYNGPILECFSKIWEFNEKQINVSCVDMYQSSERDNVPGGEMEQNPKDPRYIRLAQESLQKYLTQTGNFQSYSVVEIGKVTTQVVAGFMTRIHFTAVSNGNNDGPVLECFSKILEFNKKEIDVSCVDANQRSKRQIVGGETEQNPNDPVYMQLAQESLKKYLLETGNQQPLLVVRIDKVTTQVVSGTMTRIKFIASLTTNSNDHGYKCFSKIWEQRWLNKTEIDVSCVDENQRSKRQIPGGETEQNPNDPVYIQLAQESLQKYVLETGNQHSYSVNRIRKVTTQVVAGSMTRIHFTAVSNGNYNGPVLDCFSKIWEFNEKQINVSCVDMYQSSERDNVSGGEMEQNPKDLRYIQLAQESLQKYLTQTGNFQSYSVVEIGKVTTQVVAGFMTRIHFTAVSNGNNDGPVLECFSKILEFNKKEIDVSCVDANQRSKRQIVGGETERNPNDPVYMQLAQESLKKYFLETGNQQPLLVVRLDKVTTQVVSGTITRIRFRASLSTNSNDHVYKCFSKIWEQRWLNKTEIDVSCVDENQRSKRQIPGGETEQNPNDPVYIQLAQESLQKYVLETGNQHSYSVSRIKKVTTQVVAGSMTRIHFTAVSNGNYNGPVLECFSKIWEFNEKQINVSCVDMYESSGRDNIPGGEMEQNPKDSRYIRLAQESLQKYLTQTGNFQSYSVVKIGKVTTQVVAGFMTRIHFTAVSNGNNDGPVLECFSKILEFNIKEIDVSCVDANQRSKRQIVGGETERNPNDPKYMQLAQESLKKYLLETGNQQPLLVVRIDKVTTQVVSGTMTRISFIASLTTNSNDHMYKCFSKIWEQRLLNKTEIDVSCEVVNINGNELIEQDPSDPHYLELAHKSLQKYLVETKNKEPHKVINVESVTTQFSPEILIRLNFIVVSMNVSNSVILKCFTEVQERSVTENINIKVECNNLHKQPEDVKNTTYMQWAEESLKKYLTDTQNNQLYKVVQIEEALSHGFATNIIFVANSTNKDNSSLNCVSFILNSFSEKKINVICESTNSELSKKLSPKDDSTYNKYTKYKYNKHNKIEELPVTKPEFQLLASQSIRQYSKKVGILYKLCSVKTVTKSVTSKVVHTIYFTAFQTDCFSNVSNMRALTCNVIANSTINCRANIFGKPNQKRKIQTDCVMPEDYLDLSDSMEQNLDETPSNIKIPRNLQESNAQNFAEEALQEYLSFTDPKYVYRINGLYGFYEFLGDEKIEFSISPTTCLSIKFTGTRSNDNCPFKQPRLIYYCHAKRNLGVEGKKNIKVMCKQIGTHLKRSKRQINTELIDTENEVDEDTMYYYAKAAVSKINEKPQNNNMFKLISIHAVKSTVQMKAAVVKMYLEVAETYCVRFQHGVTIENCEEMEGLNHKLCLARIYPAPGDDLVIRHVNVVCDDDEKSFNILTGIHVFELLRLSLLELERKPEFHFKLVHQGEPQLIPTLEAKKPLKLNFVIATTNCSKNVDLDQNPYQCYIDTTIPSRSCSSFIWLETATRIIKYINVDCNSEVPRQKRSSSNATSLTPDSAEIKDLVAAALEKLEMASLHRYKQRVLHINSYSSKITTGKVTTVDFDVAYTSCLKYEWVQNITSCDIIDHLPRRHCVAQIWERLWIHNGRNINVTCEDDETPLEAHIEFESAEMAMQLAQEALKHIEAKYPHPQKQKVVRIFSLEKQIVAGIHYKMKLEVGFTRCPALSIQTNCTLDTKRHMNRFCRVNVWVRPWTDHPPNFRVSCDFQESSTSDLYHGVQAEYLFYIFVATYNPSYSNDYVEFERRFEIFKANVKKIHELNVHEKGTATYGVTRFADLTYKEFRARYTGVNTSLRNNSQVPMKEADIPNINLPANFDWREFDSVTEVKDQGSCGSGWAFSVIGNIEGQWRMQSGELVQLSEQQLLDCDTTDNGCGGGLPEHAYRAIEEMGGLETETNYPYESEGGKCVFNKTMAKVNIHGSVNITSNETAMAQWLVQNGPISVGINAMAMQFYLGGISHPWKTYCNASSIDHAVLIVGFGVKEYPAYHKKIPYWIVKNSWGKSWGEEGYYRVYRGDGTCGIDRMATSAFIPSM